MDTIFADPPDNINLGYDDHDDNLEYEAYVNFLDTLISYCVRCANITYISFNAKWMTEMGGLLYANSVVYGVQARWMVQGFTFGQHRSTDLANNFRPIVRLMREGAILYPDAVRTESDRMKIGDRRASTKGRVPGDVWFTDFLTYSRVVGNSKQRRRWHPTQLHEGLVEDCLLMATPPGGSVIDPFCGTGTTLRVCMANGWSCTTMDVSENYCIKAAEDNDIPQVADDTWLKVT